MDRPHRGNAQAAGSRRWENAAKVRGSEKPFKLIILVDRRGSSRS